VKKNRKKMCLMKEMSMDKKYGCERRRWVWMNGMCVDEGDDYD